MSSSRAILHVDADAFFAACAQATDVSLKGRPVVTGKERGIASAVSYEAKRYGITRGQRLDEVRRICPQVAIVPSDHETYSIFSQRMFAIVARYVHTLEAYSIDECFAEIEHIPEKHACLARSQAIQNDIATELGISVSLGLSTTKTLAKIASNWDKPGGVTYIPLEASGHYLSRVSLSDVWGIGPQTALRAARWGIYTAYDLMQCTEPWIRMHFAKPYRETWHELHGTQIYPVTSGEKEEYRSISKTRTFTPPSNDHAFVFAQLTKNIENACIKLRRHHLRARRAVFFIKEQNFRKHEKEVTLLHSEDTPLPFVHVAQHALDALWRPGVWYRASGVTLTDITPRGAQQSELFDADVSTAMQEVYEHVDALRMRFGKHSVFLGAALAAHKHTHAGARSELPPRQYAQLKGESRRRRLRIPYLGKVC